jgi:hypothetical protein
MKGKHLLNYLTKIFNLYKYIKRLKWNPKEYENITQITFNANKVWLPDIVLENGVGENEYLTQFKLFNPWVSYSGLVTWVPEVRIHTKCIIKVKDFPFDTQCCEINLYSWAHTAEQMVILQYGNKNVTNLTHLAQNTEWFIYNTCAMNSTIRTSSNLKWWVTRYAIKIKRQSIYHFYTLLMPCAVLSFCSILLFWLPPDSEEKITLGVTVLLAFFVNSLIVSNYTPEASFELPVIGKYYAFNIFLVASSLAGAVFILRLHFRGHKTNRVPKWVRILFRLERLRNFENNNLSFIQSSFIDLNNELQQQIRKNTTQKLLELHIYELKRARFLQLKKIASDYIIIEWKELSRKVENIFFIINLLVVVILPSVLFIEFWFQDLSVDDSLNKNCKCSSL